MEATASQLTHSLESITQEKQFHVLILYLTPQGLSSILAFTTS